MVATNLLGRGIDVERVNVVINYDMSESADTYLHRVGRAGRFGTKGLAISFVSSEDDGKVLNEVQSRFTVNIPDLPDEIDTSSYSTSLSSPHLTSWPCSHALQCKLKRPHAWVEQVNRPSSLPSSVATCLVFAVLPSLHSFR